MFLLPLPTITLEVYHRYTEEEGEFNAPVPRSWFHVLVGFDEFTDGDNVDLQRLSEDCHA